MEKNIQQYFYKITLVTPAGTRCGYLQMKVEDGLLSGCCDILNHKSMISGELLGDGVCKVTGTLTSLMQKFIYTAIGYFDDESIELTQAGTKNNYQLTGIAARRN